METATIHVERDASMEAIWSVGYRIERALARGGAFALDFDREVTPAPELFDILVRSIREAQARGTAVEILNMPSWLQFALEPPGRAQAG
jgi:hypothetical protein